MVRQRINHGMWREALTAHWCYVCVFLSLCICVCIGVCVCGRAWVRKQVCHPACCRRCGLAAVLMAFLQRWPLWGTSTHPTSRWDLFQLKKKFKCKYISGFMIVGQTKYTVFNFGNLWKKSLYRRRLLASSSKIAEEYSHIHRLLIWLLDLIEGDVLNLNVEF